MHLKRLEIQGFKSFAHKTVLDFPAGVVAIVGPNGSGKSNVIDAIRWLLGERDAKNLRGGKVDDLIFSGTSSTTRVGAAQATIYFDNSSGFFPVEFSEVAVTRKVFRDGTSQYFLNTAEVRLKDIVDFFSGSRLGTRGLTIINQGNSDLFVRATPSERREMVEEILGLKQFQLKRHEADLKLKNTKINLEKVRSMLDELLPRLRLLRRQQAKWADVSNLEKELRELENNYFSLKLNELNSNFKELAPAIQKLESEIGVASQELREAQNKLESVSQVKPGEHVLASENKKRASEISGRRALIERELGRLEAKLEFALSASTSGASEAQLIVGFKDLRVILKNCLAETNIEKLKEILKSTLHKIDELFDGKKPDFSSIKNEINSARELLVGELASLNEELAVIDHANTEISKSLEDFNKVFKVAFGLVESKKDIVHKLENNRNKLQFEEERILIRKQDLALQLRQIGRSIEEFSADRVPPKASAVLNFFSAERHMLKLRGDLASIGAVDEGLIKEATEAETRFSFLSTQMEDLVKANVDLEVLIKDLGEKIKHDFGVALVGLNEHFDKYFKLMFGGGRAKLVAVKMEELISEGENTGNNNSGLDIEIALPKKGIKNLETLSGGEKSLVSIAALFALTTISPPPFLVLDEVDAALDEVNTRRFANLIKEFSKTTQFVVVTHNRATMEVADILYGITIGSDGVSKLLSVKLT